jgi:hypothetical protein
MESNNINRISATGLKSVEIDELNTPQIIINNEGLQYFHKYNLLIPTVTEGFYNLQEEMDNIMISNTTQDLELIQLQAGLTAVQGDITTLGAGLFIVGGTAASALDLANQKSWILFFQKPLRCDISNNIYLDFNPNYFSIDASNNLTLNNNFWRKDVSNNTYFVSGKVGIGLTNPASNYILDVSGNINCNEIYRNGTPISSTLSNFLTLNGGTLTGLLTGTTISATNLTATNLTGSGSAITNLNASNITSGILSVSNGGIGTSTLSANQILIGNGSSILQNQNLSWNNTSNTLTSSIINATSNLQEANINLSSKYLQLTGGTITNNLVINNGYTTAERPYPPKLFTSSTSQVSVSFLGQTVFKETITLDTTNITYGSGTYEIYSSSIYINGSYLKQDLFNYNTSDIGGFFAADSYTNGIYNTTNHYIDNTYCGDWIIMKFVNPIVLTRYRFYRRTGYERRCPAEWRIYGSNNGIDFSYITEASNSSRLLEQDYYSGYYEKTVSSTFNTPYLYIGLVVGKLPSLGDALNFAEWQIFGKEIIPNTAYLEVGKLGIGTTDNYLQMTDTRNMNFRIPLNQKYSFTCENKQPLYIDKDSIQVENLFVLESQLVKNLNVSEKATVYDLKVNNDIIAAKVFGSNATSKILIKFQTKLGTGGLYYYNVDLDKYYNTSQNINGVNYKIFNFTSWSEDAFSIINKCTVYISSQGYKNIMFYDNWGAYLPNGNQSGWQRDTSTRYMTFITTAQKNIITIMENIL